jgi:hypothetical protein
MHEKSIGAATLGTIQHSLLPSLLLQGAGTWRWQEGITRNMRAPASTNDPSNHISKEIWMNGYQCLNRSRVVDRRTKDMIQPYVLAMQVTTFLRDVRDWQGQPGT